MGITGDHDCMDCRGHEVRERELVADIIRLRAIVDKFDKTADGVPIVPGMMVYYHDHREGGQCIVWAPVREVNKNGWVGAPYFIRDRSRLLWSSKGLAAKHLADVTQKEADRYAHAAAEAAKE